MHERAVVEQHVPAEAAEVYRAWTDVDQLARWWWPHIPDTRYELDPREGGSYLIQTEAAGIERKVGRADFGPARAHARPQRWLFLAFLLLFFRHLTLRAWPRPRRDGR